MEIAREENRPCFIEARCYRYMGHSMADPAHGTYRSKDEVDEEREHDPILSYLERLEDAGVVSQEEYDEMDEEVIDEVEAAAEFADESPKPDPGAVYEDIYSDAFPHGIDRRDGFRDALE